eukprot:g36215.t1
MMPEILTSPPRLELEEKVLDLLKHIKVDKSPGPNQMYTRTLWETTEVIAGPIAEIFISSIATGGMVSKFADDIKIRGGVDSKENYFRVQRALDQKGQWAEEWQMEFNLDK